LAASDDELARLLRGYRVAQQLVQRRAELQITAAWRQTNFGLSNASWLRWAPEAPRLSPPECHRRR
jgi:hypothetical protein